MDMKNTAEKRLLTLQDVLHGLMQRYRQQVPDVERILQAMLNEGIISSPFDVENDHIAFRTMRVAPLGIQSLEKIFLHYGYQRRDFYSFAEKKLNAFWYHPPDETFPRIFISELRVTELSPESQRLIRSYTDDVVIDPVSSLDLDNAEQIDRFLHQALWHLRLPHDVESSWGTWEIS